MTVVTLEFIHRQIYNSLQDVDQIRACHQRSLPVPPLAPVQDTITNQIQPPPTPSE